MLNKSIHEKQLKLLTEIELNLTRLKQSYKNSNYLEVIGIYENISEISKQGIQNIESCLDKKAELLSYLYSLSQIELRKITQTKYKSKLEMIEAIREGIEYIDLNSSHTNRELLGIAFDSIKNASILFNG